MNEREALKLALEALEEFGEHHDVCPRYPTYAEPENYAPCNCGFEKAITAIREALAQPDPSAYWHSEFLKYNTTSDHRMMENAQGELERIKLVQTGVGIGKPEQEPVAWRNAALRVGEDLCSVGPFGYYDMTAKQWLDWALSVVTVHAPPPHRKPLTDEKIWNLAANCLDSVAGRLQFARAIEAAHGIKE